jgi:dipeptidyl aminopeptidase/acylaminoacyl peptidase
MSFGPTALLTPDVFKKLYEMCPISHVDAVRTPVLLLVGDEDKRVSPTQATNYYHALKGRGKVVDMLRFPKDSHPLDSVEASKVGWEAGRDWFDSFLETAPLVSR